jgi:18S rRNA (adenine1779-N6/adenine1780-N6)-dimethyltransferase
MGKAKRREGGGGEGAHSAASNPIFNKELGQHILKNPLVATGIVEKVFRRDGS